MIYSDNQILFLNRKRETWPGITFPGGHVEENESIEDSVVREVKEETGLDILSLEFVDYIEWISPNKREIAFLYKSSNFKGEIKSSFEGEVFWSKLEDISKEDYSQDFDRIIEKYNLNKRS